MPEMFRTLVKALKCRRIAYTIRPLAANARGGIAVKGQKLESLLAAADRCRHYHTHTHPSLLTFLVIYIFFLLHTHTHTDIFNGLTVGDEGDVQQAPSDGCDRNNNNILYYNNIARAAHSSLSPPRSRSRNTTCLL